MMIPLDAGIHPHLPDLTWQHIAFMASNVAILAGYTFVAFKVTPLLPVADITRWGSLAFFLFCASTHADQVLHTLGDHDETWGEIAAEWHMLLIHVPQAVAVWVFALGFFVDLRRLREERHTTEAASR